MPRFLLLICILTTIGAVEPASDGAAPASGRLFMSYEVEVVTINPADPNSVAQWAEFAALGYRVVAAIPQEKGGVSLFLERLGTRGAAVVLPKQISKATAEGIHQRVREQQAEPQTTPQR